MSGRKMIRLIGIGLLLMLKLYALAEGQGALEVSFSITPDEMPAPGEAQMTFELVNHAEAAIENIRLESGDGVVSENIGNLKGGERQTLKRPHAITRAELDAGNVDYILSYDAPEEGEKKLLRLSAPLKKGYGAPTVDFTRQLSSRVVSAGETLAISYRVTNNGTLPIHDIRLSDALGEYNGQAAQLLPGETRTFFNRLAISAESRSEASLQYADASGEVRLQSLAPVSIALSKSALSADFSIGRSAFDPDRADAVLILDNAGDYDYSGITVLDDVYGGVIADGITLVHGANPTEVAFTYPVRGEGEYRWRVTGLSQTGEAVDFLTETVTLPKETLQRSVDIQLEVEPREFSISSPGSVSFDVSIANTGSVSAKDLRLYEVNRGDIRRLAVLPTGEPARFSFAYEVSENTQFVFCLNYQDADGHTRTVSTDPIDIDISASGAPPEIAWEEDVRLRGTSTKPGSGMAFTVLLLIAVAALVSMLTLLLVTSLRARRERRAAQKKRQTRRRKRTEERQARQ